MGNVSNPGQWATMERLRFIERSAFWRGVVNRQDLGATFGLSMAQASADLQKYQEMNPGALVYNLKQKRYEGAREFTPRVHDARIEEAMTIFLRGGGRAGKVASLAWLGEEGGVASKVDVLELPERQANLRVLRNVFLAVHHDRRLRIKYHSVRSSAAEWRWIRPHAFAHDGSRWHARAWCEENRDFRDFTLSRMSDADWPEEGAKVRFRDSSWREEVTLELRPARALGEIQKRAIEMDYGMRRGVLRITVRKALEGYLRDRLHLPLRDGTRPKPLLEVVAE
jgi:predicted DNA-binding transcriptional regulator YafY